MEVNKNPVGSGVDRFTGLRKVISDNGWITPAGVFYACTPLEHDVCAEFLLKNNIIHVKKLLEDREEYSILSEIDQNNPRSVLKAAGFALLSDGLMTETNLPKYLTTKQLELVGRAKLTFSSESGKLDPLVYVEYQKILNNEKRLIELGEDIDGIKGYRSVASFVENPDEMLDLYDCSKTDEIFSLLSQGSDEELSIGKIGKSVYRWRRMKVGLSEVFVEHINHDHSEGGSYECYPAVEDNFKLVSKLTMNKFLLEISSKGKLTSIDGNLEMIGMETLEQVKNNCPTLFH